MSQQHSSKVYQHDQQPEISQYYNPSTNSKNRTNQRFSHYGSLNDALVISQTDDMYTSGQGDIVTITNSNTQLKPDLPVHHLAPHSSQNGPVDDHGYDPDSGHDFHGLEENIYSRRRRYWPKAEADQMTIDFCGVISVPSVRQFALFHYIQLFVHALVLVNAILSIVVSFLDPTLTIKYKLGHALCILTAIFVDLKMAHTYYKHILYAPYSLASPFLYLFKGLILIPETPDVIFLQDKICVLFQGILFVILPYLNIINIVNSISNKGGETTSAQHEAFNKVIGLFGGEGVHQLQVLFFYIVLFQVAMTLFTWVMFCLFYTVFVYEVILRVVLFPLLCFRKRLYLVKVEDDPSHPTTPAETSSLLPSTQTLQPQRFKFVSNNVYHNYYAYEQHRINSKPHHQFDAGSGSDDTSSSGSLPLYNPTPNGSTVTYLKQYEIDQQEYVPMTPYHDHIFVSHVSDPIMYWPYSILWPLM